MNFQLAAFLAVLGSPAFLGAQNKAQVSDKVERQLAFDPLAFLRRPPRRGRRNNTASWKLPHCGAKQAARYKRQAVKHEINRHYEARMRWNETVYPRVLEHQAQQRASLAAAA